ncbi:MAG: hypothetical protein JSV89_10580 [Spirochaetaceae bacterium]|nr:MAG: hypothetical protein JSV89_10580 [Spirochaetaceae bacterium]
MKLYDWWKAKNSLKHVLWIGGSACSGKSTISTRLAEGFGFIRYHGDDHIGEHIDTAAEEDSPFLYKIHEQGIMNYLGWVLTQKAEKIVQVIYDIYREDLRLVSEDLLTMPADKPIVVDLFAGHPTWELRQLADPEKAIFLVSTNPFIKEGQRKRFQKGGILSQALEQCPTSVEVFMKGYVESVHMRSADVREECEKYNLSLLITGGNMSVDEVYSAVCMHFGLS